MSYAVAGFDLEVDLTRGNIERVASDPQEITRHLGGEGAAARILWDRVPPEVAPFSENNLLIFSAGLLCGTPVPGANHTIVSSIDPQSDLHAGSSFGGFFAAQLKHAGYDKIVIRGKSSRPVYLSISDDQVALLDASHLLGKSALETATLIREELDEPGVEVAAIGPAGENRVFQASIEHGNSCASQGPGAVMGDKGLKAIAVRGTKDVELAARGELFDVSHRQSMEMHKNPCCGDPFQNEADDEWRMENLYCNEGGGALKGFLSKDLMEEWEVRVESERISYQWENYSQEMEEVRERVVERSELLRGTGCYNCSKQCRKAISLPGGRVYFLKNYGRLAYAMAAYPELAFNYEVLFKMQDLGLDEVPTAQVVAFALRLHNAGILTEEDLPDFPADGPGRFLHLLEKIAKRQGVGDVLADGVHLACRRIGKGTEALANTIKNMEQLPLRPGSANYLYFLMYATGERLDISRAEGSYPQTPIADRQRRAEFVKHWDAAPQRFKDWFMEWEPGAQHSLEKTVAIVEWNDLMHYADGALGICPHLSSSRGQFGGRAPYHLYNLPHFVSLAAGLELDAEGLWEVCSRNRQMVRAMNVRRGLRRSDDSCPGGFWESRDVDMEQKHLDAYYLFKGWNHEGIPSGETLDGLDLGFVSEELIARGMLPG